MPAAVLAEIARLRMRADQLSWLALRIERCDLDSAALRSGEDTWIGPTADAFRQQLWCARQDRDAAAREARDLAARLAAEADRLKEVLMRAGVRS